jgi:hypothetical protein
MFIFPSFWIGNKIWSIGSYITISSVVANRYFDIKKTANKNNQQISISSNKITKWLSIEKVVSYLWILGMILIAISRWLNE